MTGACVLTLMGSFSSAHSVRGQQEAVTDRDACLLMQERIKAAMTGACVLAPVGSPSSAHGGRGHQELATDGSARACSGGCPSQCPWRKGLTCA